MVAALRQRTQGPVRAFLDANKKIPTIQAFVPDYDETGRPINDANMNRPPSRL